MRNRRMRGPAGRVRAAGTEIRQGLLAALALALAFTAPLVASSADVPPSFVGDALDRDGRLRYREFHEFAPAAPSGFRSVTVYRDAEGREIGRMEADYSTYRFAPHYRMVDLRHDSEQVVRREGNRVFVFDREGDRTRTAELTVRPGRDLIVGPGFNEFIRANWDALLTGGVIACDFAHAGRRQIIGFRIRHDAGRSTARTARFRVEVDNAFLRLLAPSLQVEYDRVTRQLASYEGPSNLHDDEGRPQHVVIRFPATLVAQAR
jgi:hypothetical protein